MKKTLLALASLALVLTLGACQSKTETTTTTTPTPVTDAAPPAEAQPKPAEGALETLTGTYTGTEQGDYYHALIKGDDGTDYSYFFAPDLPEARSMEMMDGMYDGKKVKIQWRKVTRHIEEAGGDMEIDEIVNIEAI